MLTILLYTSIIGVCAGLIGYVYSCELTEKGMLLDWWWDLNYWLFAIEHCETGKEPKLWKVIIGCERCVSGQIALWSCVGAAIQLAQSLNDILLWIFFTAYSCSLSILTSQFIKKWR